MNRLIILLLVCSIPASRLFAQLPNIQNIELVSTFPNDKIVITGSGFSGNPAQLQVWFDQVQGVISSSTDFSIEVVVPAQSRLANLTVVNLVSRLSAQSSLKFMPVFHGTFDPLKVTTPLTFTSTNAVFDIISGDIDGDHKPDLIGSKFENTATNLMMLLNQSTVGNAAFTNTNLASLNANAPTGHLALGDLNGDGKLDLAASRSGTTANSVFLLRNTSTVGSPGFAAPIVLSLDVTHFARQVAIQDLNGDGKPEVIVANSTSNDLYIFKNESSGGTLTFNSTPIKISVTGASNTLALEIQDIDGDGKKDIVATQNQSNDLFILKNTSSASDFTFSITKISLFGTFNDLASADFNRDGKLDLVITSVFGAQAVVLINQSTASTISFQSPITLTTDTGPFGVDVNDINGDGFADFIIPNRGTNTIHVYLHNGNLSPVGFTKSTLTTLKNNWFARVGDLDGDAKPDLAFTTFTNPSTFSVDILRNTNCHTPRILNALPLAICPTQTIRLLTIPLPGLTFDWRKDGVSIKINAEPFVDITGPGNYTVTAISESGACAILSGSVTVTSGAGTLPADPVITSNSPVCSGQTISLSTAAVAGATYSWTGPNNFVSSSQNISIPNASISNAGIYSLLVKVGDCASNTVTQRVDVATFGSFSVSSNNATNIICQGQSVTLSINSQTGYSFQWMKDGLDLASQTGTTLNVTQEGSYKVRVTNIALSCSQETAAVAVTVYTTPVASFQSPPTACVNSPILFSNTSTTDVRATTAFAWQFGDTNTSTAQNPTHTYTTAQAFNPQLTVSYTGVTGCSNNTAKNISIVAAQTPTITASLLELCPTETSTLSVAGNFATYQWSNNATTASIDVSAPGDYSVTTADANGCNGNASITLLAKTDCPTGSTDLEFPLVFTPNGDVQNDRWVIPGIENYNECTMNIFDGRGRRIFQVTGYPVEGWDGTFEGKEVPEGTYYFVFGCPTGTPSSGSVLIVR